MTEGLGTKTFKLTRKMLEELTNQEIREELIAQGIKIESEEKKESLINKLLTKAREGFTPETQLLIDLITGKPLLKLPVSRITLNSQVLKNLTIPQLKDEAKNQDIKISGNTKNEIIKSFLSNLDRKKGSVKLPLTQPLRTLVLSLTCPAYFGADIQVRVDKDATILTLTKEQVMILPKSAITDELKNQNIQYEEDETIDELADKLVNFFRANPATYRRKFSSRFGQFIDRQKSSITTEAKEEALKRAVRGELAIVPELIIGIDKITTGQATVGRQSLLLAPPKGAEVNKIFPPRPIGGPIKPVEKMSIFLANTENDKKRKLEDKFNFKFNKRFEYPNVSILPLSYSC